MWETRDSATTWIPKTDDHASLAIGAVTLAPSDARIIYVGTGEPEFFNGAYAGQGVLKSADAGTTWELLATATFARTSFSDIKVHPTDPSIAMAATTRGGAGRFAMILPQELPAAPPRGVFKSVDGRARSSLPPCCRARMCSTWKARKRAVACGSPQYSQRFPARSRTS